MNSVQTNALKRLRSNGSSTRLRDRLSKYPRLRILLEHLRCTSDKEFQLLCLLRQLQLIEEWQRNHPTEEIEVESLLGIFHS